MQATIFLGNPSSCLYLPNHFYVFLESVQIFFKENYSHPYFCVSYQVIVLILPHWSFLFYLHHYPSFIHYSLRQSEHTYTLPICPIDPRDIPQQHCFDFWHSHYNSSLWKFPLSSHIVSSCYYASWSIILQPFT